MPPWLSYNSGVTAKGCKRIPKAKNAAERQKTATQGKKKKPPSQDNKS